jgi:hypothetical protein
VPRRETCLYKDYKECAGNMTKKMRRIPQDEITVIGDLANPEPGKRLRQAEYELQSRLVSQPVMWR